MTLHCFVVDHHERSAVQDRRVGITAGASAPPHLVNQLADACLDVHHRGFAHTDSAESRTSNSASPGSWDE
jgi:4-hydroxy-3-methylbut-2-enyl diphosphate reductase IspH